MQGKMRGAYVIASSGDPLVGGGWNNQQLLKDCGIIPYLLYKNHGFRAVMVGLKVDDTYPYLEYVHGLEMDFLAEDTVEARLAYINEHAVDMDLLILYGAYPVYIPIVEHYKRIRPDGKIYLATDMNIAWATRIPQEDPAYKKFLHSCDVIAASCRATQKYLSAKWSVPVNLIRNGWYNLFGINFASLFERKANIILTVGRIGTEQKRNEDLLNAFAKVADELPDWNVRLVGSVEDSFNAYVERYFATYPNLRGRVEFTGLIDDKAALMDEYKRAKIFCMTSTFEGAPNVAAEALFSGDYVITSAIDAADDLTDDGTCGRTFPIGDVDALANILLEVCRDDKLILEGGRHSRDYALRNFDAEHLVARLNYLLYAVGGVFIICIVHNYKDLIPYYEADWLIDSARCVA